MGRRGQGQDRRPADPASTTSSSATRAAPTPAIPSSPATRRTSCRCSPAASSRPGVHVRHHRRRGVQPGQGDRGARRAGQPRRQGRRQPDAQRPGPRDLPLALRRRPGDGPEHVRRREHRHHAARHRPLLPRQGRPVATPSGWATCTGRRSASGSSTSPRRRTARSRRCTRRASSSRSTPRRSTSSTAATPSGCKPYVADTTAYLLDRGRGGQADPVRGRPGALLDVDHGTYPFVTSSNSSGVGVSSGSGVPGRYHRPRHRRHEGVHHARRRRAVSHRAGQRDRPAHPRPGQRVRHRHQAARAAAAGSTPWPSATRRGSAASTRSA